jgi:putative peptidoglycan lipid II flippase
LYFAWTGAGTGAAGEGGLLDRIAAVPGLHMGIALASSMASYLNLWLLWRGLRRDGIYQREPGWARHWLRLAAGCVVLVGVLLAGLWLWPDWSAMPLGQRVLRLLLLIGAASAAYVAALIAGGFRLRDLRAE